MYFIKVNEKDEVVTQRYFEFVTPEQQAMMKDGFIVPNIPESEIFEDKVGVLMWNGHSLYYRYVDKKTPEQDEIEKLKEKVKLQDEVLQEVMFTLLPEFYGGGF